jgi:peptidoglycan/LPS O-acetylase OafA/YrhL
MARPQTTSSGTLAESSGELRGLTGLRIVAAVWVVAFHFHFTPLAGVAEVVDELGPLITSGALGVDLFFVLSGFVIAHTYLDRLGPALRAGATARFLWARASRMWPLYVLVLHLFGLWLVARLVFGSDSEIAFQGVQPVLGVREWLEQVFMVQMWSSEFLDGASWVGPTWSISAEWLAYLLFPVAALGFFRLRNLPVAVLGLASLALMGPMAWAYLTTGSPYHPWSWLVRILCGFGAGVLTYLAVRKLRATGRARRGASVLAVAVPVAIAAGLLLGESAGPGRGGVVIALFPLLVGALAVADRGPATVLSARWAVSGGHISYSLYLVHIPIFEVYWLALRRFPWLGPGTLLAHVVGALAVLSTFAVAALAFRLVEEPARRRMRRLAPFGANRPAPADRRRPAGPEQGACTSPVARAAAARQALARDAAGPQARHAASPTRRSTLAAALIKAQSRPPAHRAGSWAGYERTEHVRSAYLQAGS